MTTHDPRHEPLDTNERELARVVRALPGGEPPAALDAMILKAAQDAVASAPTRRRLRWLAGGAAWGIGSAAAAVLAIGVGWQVLNPQTATQLPLPARAPAPSAAPAAADESAGTTVEFRDEPRPAFDNSAPPAPVSPAAPRARVQAFPASPSVMAAPPPPPPPPAAPAPIATAPAVTAQATGTVNAIDVTSVESTTILTAEQLSKIDAAAAAAANAESDRKQARRLAPPAADAGAAAERADEARSERESQSYARESAKAVTDFRGRPATWLAHIRELRDSGQLSQARDDLAQFRKRYPDFVVPSDLTVLQEP